MKNNENIKTDLKGGLCIGIPADLTTQVKIQCARLSEDIGFDVRYSDYIRRAIKNQLKLDEAKQ